MFAICFSSMIFGAQWLILNKFGTLNTFQIHGHHFICNNPLLFWKYKKLFFYKDIEYISLYRINSEKAYGLRIQLRHNKKFKYRIDIDYADELIYLLEKLGVAIIVEIYDYHPRKIK